MYNDIHDRDDIEDVLQIDDGPRQASTHSNNRSKQRIQMNNLQKNEESKSANFLSNI